mmetsp:Transcript_24162/g.35805  ORF Transcript_24162/g.35805 Transcript_24162/m.35805 type:complete len:119 (-) Transcript_24162:759-1115(-)
MTRQGGRNDSRASSIYPQPYASGSEVITRVSGGDLSTLDKVLVSLSSLIVVGSVAWVPLLFGWLWRKWKKTNDVSRRAFYATLMIAFIGVLPSFDDHLPASTSHCRTLFLRFLDLFIT